jgi:SAM-dependent methyltransferase
VIAWPDTFVSHPAPYSRVILEAIDRLLPASGTFLDPMAGSGKIFNLERPGRTFVATEIEPEFAALHPRTLLADATRLPFDSASFDGGATSPTYPNRMAGDYAPPGWTKNPKGRRSYSLSKRWLARDASLELAPTNTARYSTRRGVENYWWLHAKIWAEVARVIRPGGIFVLNTKDTVQALVTDPHVRLLTDAGFEEVHREIVKPPGYRNGANRHLRVGHEDIVVLRREG